MKRVNDIIGLSGVALLFIAAAMSDSGTASLAKVIAVGTIASLMILLSLGNANKELQSGEEN